MNNFKIAIEEMISDTFEVEANSLDEAIEIAKEKYKNGEFVLESGNLVAKQMAVIEPNKETEWIEF